VYHQLLMGTKGILLAGGRGTRLYPSTAVISKQLLPVYDKPMIYYPLATLMFAGIREILVVTTPRDLPPYRELLRDGSAWGISIEYAEQPRPEGIAQAFEIGARFVANDGVMLALGDNIFHGPEFGVKLARRVADNDGATIFAYPFRDPKRYGVVELDSANQVVSLEEKPEHPRSSLAVPGLYIYDHHVVEIARGFGDITDVNRAYLAAGRLRAHVLSRDNVWLDAGTHDSLLAAASYVAITEQRDGVKIGCLEEVAYRMGFIDRAALERIAASLAGTDYGRYLSGVARVA